MIMSRYKKSDGAYISKTYIDKRVRQAKKTIIEAQFDIYGFNFCQQCQRSSGVRLDCSHIESVDSCQKNGYAEKSYDIDNIEILCRECHQKRDKLTLG
ncbi:HNH endonuclease [Rhodobacteraceae phage LS06-2018-MD05]|nr:HNH endonuclease [Rhodobacteraceae phage LS06-2018-MD05]